MNTLLLASGLVLIISGPIPSDDYIKAGTKVGISACSGALDHVTFVCIDKEVCVMDYVCKKEKKL